MFRPKSLHAGDDRVFPDGTRRTGNSRAAPRVSFSCRRVLGRSFRRTLAFPSARRPGGPTLGRPMNETPFPCQGSTTMEHSAAPARARLTTLVIGGLLAAFLFA